MPYEKLKDRKRIAELFAVGLVGKAHHCMVRFLPAAEAGDGARGDGADGDGGGAAEHAVTAPVRARLTVAVGKRLGIAVIRNRIRRRMRAALAETFGPFPAGDYAFLPRASVKDCDYADLLKSIRKAVGRLSPPTPRGDA